LRAWQVEALSDPGRMRLAELPVPTPAHDQYLVKVEAAGLNFLDTLAIKGRYQTKPALPFTPGVEVVGTIVSGEGAGTRVACALIPIGASRTRPSTVSPRCASWSTSGWGDTATTSTRAAAKKPSLSCGGCSSREAIC